MIKKTCLVLALVVWASAAQAAPFEAAAGSKITYQAIHPAHEVNGVTEKVRGKVEYDPAKPLEFIGLVNKNVQADWADFDSGNKNRDANVRVVVNADKFPSIAFVIEAIEKPVQTGTVIAGQLRGRLYINGVKQTLTAPVSIDVTDAKRILVSAKLITKMTDFKIDRPSLLFVKVNDDLIIDVNLVFQPATTAP